jgi:hypothetical protein
LIKVTASQAMPATLSGVWPVERPTPALSKAITGRSSARAFTTAGPVTWTVPGVVRPSCTVRPATSYRIFVFRNTILTTWQSAAFRRQTLAAARCRHTIAWQLPSAPITRPLSHGLELSRLARRQRCFGETGWIAHQSGNRLQGQSGYRKCTSLTSLISILLTAGGSIPWVCAE